MRGALKTISGKVTSAEDGAPIPGANVMIKGTRLGNVTDTNGNFTLTVDDPNQTLLISFIGMHSKEIILNTQSVVNVQLVEDATQLSEVVVAGYSLEPNPPIEESVLKLASPVGGLKAYNAYLENNLRYPSQALSDKIKGKVVVQFTIETNGNLSKFNVLKGLGHGCDDEVIRLVKDGPDWTPSTRDDVAVESEVKVKLKFDPEKAKR